MKIDSIKLKDTDTNFTSRPTRTAEIKTRIGTIETPSRAATLFEYNSKAKIPTNIIIDNPITVKYTSLGHGTLSNFLTKNTAFEYLHNSLESSNDRTQHSMLQFAIFQPTITENKEKNTPPAMQILQNNKELEKFLDLIIALQENLNLDIISLPYLNLPISILEEVYVKRANQIRRLGKEPFFVLNLKHQPSDFERLTALFVEKLQLNLIGLNFQRFQTAALNYHTLSKYYDRDILFFTVQVGRFDPAYDDVSSSHYLPFLTNDIFSIAAPHNFDPNSKKDQSKPTKQTTEPYRNKLLKLRLFNKENLKLQTIFPLMEKYESLLHDVGDPRDFRLLSMLQNYLNEGKNEVERNQQYSNLKSFTAVHELKTSFTEFAKLRKYIKQNDTKSYVSEHETLNYAIKQMA